MRRGRLVPLLPVPLLAGPVNEPVCGVKGLLTLRAVQAVAEPPDGDEVDGPLGHGLDLRAEPADVDVDRPHPPVVIGSPDAVEELAPAVRASRMRGQQREQSELLRTQVDELVAPPQLVGHEVELEVVGDGQRCARSFARAGPRVEPGEPADELRQPVSPR